MDQQEAGSPDQIVRLSINTSQGLNHFRTHIISLHHKSSRLGGPETQPDRRIGPNRCIQALVAASDSESTIASNQDTAYQYRLHKTEHLHPPAYIVEVDHRGRLNLCKMFRYIRKLLLGGIISTIASATFSLLMDAVDTPCQWLCTADVHREAWDLAMCQLRCGYATAVFTATCIVGAVYITGAVVTVELGQA